MSRHWYALMNHERGSLQAVMFSLFEITNRPDAFSAKATFVSNLVNDTSDIKKSITLSC